MMTARGLSPILASHLGLLSIKAARARRGLLSRPSSFLVFAHGDPSSTAGTRLAVAAEAPSTPA
eukprot:365048-Chlamydomonas_euryale.AAC.3